MISTAHDCIPCFVRQAAEAVAMTDMDAPAKERLLRALLRDLSNADWSAMPVVLAQQLQRTVRETANNPDPYRSLKDKMNRTALALLPDLAEAARRRPNPREAIVRLAIAGNLLDAGSKNRLEPDDLPGYLNAIWDAPLIGSPSTLFNAAQAAGQILYLADNAGEIVFDKLLVEALPKGRVTVAVRGAPVINDATMADAETAGLTALARVIANGADAPGTVLDECSQTFRDCFENADLIISKGQGNFETLSDTAKPIFFLLTVKCGLIAQAVNAPIGTLVVATGRGQA